jgi:hypothetical protein
MNLKGEKTRPRDLSQVSHSWNMYLFLYVYEHVENNAMLQPGLWSRYTKLHKTPTPTPTPTPRFLKLPTSTPTPTTRFLKLRLLHKSSICINNGKPIRHFVTTT